MLFAPKRRSLILGVGTLSVAAIVAAIAAVPGAQAVPRVVRHSSLEELRIVGGGSSGPALVAAPSGRSVERPRSVPAGASAATVARAHLAPLASLWGVTSAPSSLREISTASIAGVGPVVRFAQLVDGVPVYGGQLVVSLDATGGLQSIGGETVPGDPSLNFEVSAESAQSVARASVADRWGRAARTLRVGPATRYAYDPALVGEAGNGVGPVWRVVVVGKRGSSARAEVLVSATDGGVVRVNGSAAAVRRAVCDAGPTTASYTADAAYGWCGENDTARVRDVNHDGSLTTADPIQPVYVPYNRLETSTLSSVTEVNAAYDAVTATSNFYSSVLGYDLTANIAPTDQSVGQGSSTTTRTLAATVRSCNPVEWFYDKVPATSTNVYADATSLAVAGCPYDNAYWSDLDYTWDPNSGTPYPGGQMFIGEGLSANDVIGHEITHGVTAATSGLVYSNESGALNESMSDVFGQLVQEYAAPATDPSWLVGDKLDGPVLFGALRSMSDPTLTAPTLPEGDVPQPDSMTSANWNLDPLGGDQGGVHANSGVGNKAAYLIAHGTVVNQPFNGVVVTRLDQGHAADSIEATTKLAWLYWTTQNLLPANANYRRFALTLDQACRQLAGSATNTHGFVLADCTGSVAQAINATRMTVSHASTSLNHTTVSYGSSVVVTGRITDARSGGAAGTGVWLQKFTRGGSAWSTVSAGTTGSTGTKSWTVKPTASSYYRVVQVATGVLPAVYATPRLVSVRPTILRTASSKKIAYGSSFTVKGTVRPGGAVRWVQLQRYSNGAWRTLSSARVSSSSTYSLKYKPTSHADWNYRIRAAGSTKFVSGTSAKFFVTVN